jgi:hypothetical protein
LEEDPAVAAVHQAPVVVLGIKRRGRDAVRRVPEMGRKLLGEALVVMEEAQQGRRRALVVLLESAVELGTADEAVQALAGERGTREGGGVRWDADENLAEGVVRDVLHRMRRAHGGTHTAECGCVVVYGSMLVLVARRGGSMALCVVYAAG